MTRAARPVVDVGTMLRRLEAIEARLAALERARGPRDGADADLLLAILEAIGDRAFTSVQLYAHAQTVAPALLAAMLAADIDGVHPLGTVFRRLHGIEVRGLRLERQDGKYHRDGTLWRVQTCEGDLRSDAAVDTHEHG
jgi:hypothetical protein